MVRIGMQKKEQVETGNPEETADEVIARIKAFAKEHGLLLPSQECLEHHASRYLNSGHCPCKPERGKCPCPEALSDIETQHYCACAILMSPKCIDRLRKK